jgi:hypothetical protein
MIPSSDFASLRGKSTPLTNIEGEKGEIGRGAHSANLSRSTPASQMDNISDIIRPHFDFTV